jgi:allantoinase
MHYDYVALPDRKPLKWPNGSRIAVIFTLNLEYWELSHDSVEPLYPGGPATIPHVLPGNVPDYANWTWREYGQRVGIWRLIDVFDRAGVPSTCTMNAMIGIERKRIIDAVNERGWEILAHNYAQTDILSSYAHQPEKERDVIRRTLDVYEQTVGRPAKGWLSSSIRCTPRTPEFLKEFGLLFHSDFLNDDQPYLIHTARGPLVCVPYSNDINDFAVFSRGAMTTEDALSIFKEQFDQLYLEGAESGRIMNVGLHPHVMGQAYRVRALRDLVDYIKSFAGVWFPRREEIANWYLANHKTHIE